MEVNTKEISQYKKELSRIEKYSEGLQITSQKDYEEALGEGKNIKDKLKVITDRKTEITKPLNIALKSVRELFSPLETIGENALKTIKDKMLSFTIEETKRAEEAKLKIAKKLEDGKLTIEKAVEKIEAVEVQEKTTKTENGKATTVSRTAWKVVDKSKIPLEFLEPDMVKIKQSFRVGVPVAGVEEFDEVGVRFG